MKKVEELTDDEIREKLNMAATEVSNRRREGDCLVVLLHRFEYDQWAEGTRMLNGLLQGLSADGPVIVLCGHAHFGKVSPELSDRVLIIQSVPPVSGASVPEGGLPMVRMVRLDRKDHRVESLAVFAFFQQTSSWLVDSESHDVYDYNYNKGRWVRGN